MGQLKKITHQDISFILEYLSEASVALAFFHCLLVYRMTQNVFFSSLVLIMRMKSGGPQFILFHDDHATRRVNNIFNMDYVFFLTVCSMTNTFGLLYIKISIKKREIIKEKNYWVDFCKDREVIQILVIEFLEIVYIGTRGLNYSSR